MRCARACTHRAGNGLRQTLSSTGQSACPSSSARHGHARHWTQPSRQHAVSRQLCSCPRSGQDQHGAKRNLGQWRWPRSGLIQLDGGRHFCVKRGVVVDPHRGTEFPLTACATTAAIVRRHAWRLISASLYASLGLTCIFADFLNESEHRGMLRDEIAVIRSKLARCREMERHSREHRMEAMELTVELNDALSDCRQLDMLRDSMMNWMFAASYASTALLLLCRPGCALRVRWLIGLFAGVGLPMASASTVVIAKRRGAELDWSLLIPPPPFTHFIPRGSGPRGWW